MFEADVCAMAVGGRVVWTDEVDGIFNGLVEVLGGGEVSM